MGFVGGGLSPARLVRPLNERRLTNCTQGPHHARPRPATRRQATPTPRPRPRTHARRSRRTHIHDTGRVGGVGLAVGGVRALRPCGAAFVQKRTFLCVLYGSPDARAQERGGDGGGGDAQRQMGQARALGGQAGGTAACAARRVRARRVRTWRGRAARRGKRGAQQTTGRSGRRAGRVSRRRFDAAPPGLNRGAGLVPGTQVAGGGERRRAGTEAGKGERAEEANSVVPISTFARFCRSLGAISSIRRWLYGYTVRSGELGPRGEIRVIELPVYRVG